MAGRPGIQLYLGSGVRATATPALVDTGASVSVISKDLAQRIFTQEGRPYLLIKAHRTITGASGHGLQLCGLTEVMVRDIGIVSFHVIKNLQDHHCILGWDLLNEKGFSLDDKELVWGGKRFTHSPYTTQSITPISTRPAALVDAAVARAS